MRKGNRNEMWKPLNYELQQFTAVESEESAAGYEAERRAKLFEIHPRSFVHESYDKEVEGLEGLEKTKDELRGCAEVITALETLLGKLRLKYVLKHNPLSADYIHVLDPVVFAESLEEEVNSVGFHTPVGNIYMPRTESMMEFVSTLSHELAHTISYKHIVAQHVEGKFVNKRMPAEGFASDIHLIIVGFQFNDIESGVVEADGINEAATELMAQQIRGIYVDQSNRLTHKEKEALEVNLAYGMQCIVVEAVILEIASYEAETKEKYDENYLELLKLLFTDYLGGSGYFHGIMDHYMPGKFEVLSQMGLDNDSPLEVAKELGLPADVLIHLAIIKEELDRQDLLEETVDEELDLG